MVDIRQAYVNLGNGMLVERDLLGIAQRVSAYDQNLKVQFLNAADAGVNEPPYRIVEMCADGIERPVFSVWKLDEMVLQRIFAADNQKFDVISRVESSNAKVKAQGERRYRDRMAEVREIATTVLASPKSNFTVPEHVLSGDREGGNELVTFRDTPGPSRTKK